MLLPQVSYWSQLINFIIQNYFVLESSSTCILWNKNIDFVLLPFKDDDNLLQIVNINRLGLADALERDVYNFTAKIHERFIPNNLTYDDLVAKLTVAIEHTHCEDDIPVFTRAFHNASIYSLWRSIRTKFLFVYRKDIQEEPYFDDILFQDQPNILIIEAVNHNSTIFELKTNKFVGSLSAHPEQLESINTYNATAESFENNQTLYPDKIKDLQGREIILGAFDYRPFVVFDFDKQPQVYDWADDNPQHSVFLDGTEVKILLIFCEIYNCTVQADSSEKWEWGVMFPNGTGKGLIGMVADRKTHIGAGALYSWYVDYVFLDMTAFLGRSGITCMVPAPHRLRSWNLPVKPFQFTLWLGVFGCLVLEAISLLVTRRLEQTIARDDNSWYVSFQFGYQTTLKLFISQGSSYVVNATSVRMVLFSCYMIDIIITSIYGGGLASILTLPTLSEAADSLERLYSHNLLWTATSESWIVTIRAVDDPMIKHLLSTFRTFNVDETRELAKTADMGFIVERMTFGHFGNIEYLTSDSLDRLKLMVDDVYFQFTNSFVPRLWAFLYKYNNLIFNWHSSGMDKFWEWKVAADNMNRNFQERIQASMNFNFDTGPVKLDMDNFAGLILIWIIGIVISIVGFILELMYYKFVVSAIELQQEEEQEEQHEDCETRETSASSEVFEIE